MSADAVGRIVLLGLGTNRGDRVGYLRRALRGLDEPGLRLLKISSIYESDAMLPEGAPDEWNDSFLNLAVSARTTLGPRELLGRVKAVERQLGRRASARWAPREIDIDILAMEGVSLAEADLKIPHVGLAERPFALLPFAELAPDWRLSRPHGGVGAGAGAESPAHVLARPWSGVPAGEVPFRTRRSSYSLTELAAIINVTPDSFSDGGAYVEPLVAVARAREAIGDGASVLDVGAESTRPGATGVDPETEWHRLSPVLDVLRALPERGSFRLSVDTRHGATARRAIALGADWINDVSGGADPDLRRAVAESEATLVLMHNLGVPPRPDRILSASLDPVEAVRDWAHARITELVDEGVPRERIVLDPGLGFGKSPAQNLALVAGLARLRGLGLPLFVGHSRKGFLVESHDGAEATAAGIAPARAADRDTETLVVSLALVEQAADFLRVHDVAVHRRALAARARLGVPYSWSTKR